MTDLEHPGQAADALFDEPDGVVGEPARITRKAARGRSTTTRKVLKVLIAMVSLILILGVGALGYTWFRIEQIPKVAIPKDPGIPIDGPLPTIAIPVNGETVDGGPVMEDPAFVPGETVPAGSVTPGSKPTGTSKPGDAPPDSIADPAEGDINTPIATVKAPAGKLVFGALIDTTGVAAFGGPNAKNYLMIGVDSRSDIPEDQQDAFGDVGGSRSDTIMLLRLDPSSNQAWVLSFPRDLYVRIAGTNQFNRLNAAYSRGAGTLTSTIRENFNVPVDHFAIVDFVGFQKVVEAVGGVTICFPKDSRDTKSGLNQPAGCNLLDPKQATAFVRSRHLQEGRNGVWTNDPRGDLGRIQRQQAFIRATLSQAVQKGMSDPVTFNSLLISLKDALTLDSEFGFGDIASLAADLRSFDPNLMQTFTVPVTPKRINGKEVLLVQTVKGRTVIGQFGQRKTAKQ